MPNPVTHFEVLGKDAAALQKFYKGAFNWNIQPAMPTYGMVMHGEGKGIDGGVGATMDGSAGHVTFYVEVADIAASLVTIGSLGGRTVQEPMDVPDGPKIALFADPEGHVVGLVQAGTGNM